ncbi:DUF2656 domain-containing protein [Leptothoe spongobia]|uniref:DUF2656 domain-containing protein n=1 Tax=Leptothoe spongobia TAU-MAC 1115 TaxID=1967444 RepID=A0A947DID7_9CYAN|nr:DUF2656 domain-containing protein [Leptothoe spongobia]MBT9317573.1 DUF2656 domain-containing protein [Leptothoe spongobia TAU-MAC 1115]
MTATTRMLLSHNCTLPEGQVSTLSRADFANVFIEGLKAHGDIQCSLIENPHWMVEVLFSTQSPTDIAALCAQSLASQRVAEPDKQINRHTVMLLGGLKTSPAIGTSPTSLQPGEWGVDVVETVSPDQFLAGLNWDTVTASKPPEQIFKVIRVAE